MKFSLIMLSALAAVVAAQGMGMGKGKGKGKGSKGGQGGFKMPCGMKCMMTAVKAANCPLPFPKPSSAAPGSRAVFPPPPGGATPAQDAPRPKFSMDPALMAASRDCFCSNAGIKTAIDTCVPQDCSASGSEASSSFATKMYDGMCKGKGASPSFGPPASTGPPAPAALMPPKSPKAPSGGMAGMPGMSGMSGMSHSHGM